MPSPCALDLGAPGATGDDVHAGPVQLVVRSDRTAILALGGELTADRVEELAAAVAPILEADDVQELVVNLAAVPLIAAAAIPVLHAVGAALEGRGGSLVLLDAAPHVQRVLRICGLLAEGSGASARSLSDAGLAAAVQARSATAFAELHRRHHPALARMASRYVGDTIAEDVANDVLLAIWHAPERYEPGRSRPASYLRLRVRGAAIDRLRAETTRRARERRDLMDDAGPELDLAELVVVAARAEAVRSAIGRLPDLERVVVEAAFLGDQSYRRVAEVLQLPEGTVKSRMRGALTHLRHELERADV